jgi:hypothetical protein
MLSTFYRVSIAQISGSDDNAGFIDQKTVEMYMANNGVAPTITPSSLTTSTNKVRANVRYQNVIEKLQQLGNMYTSNVVITGGSIDTPPTTVAFTLEVERGDSILTTRDEANTAIEITGANAIVRSVARGLMETRQNYVYPVFDPTKTTAAQNGSVSNAAARVGDATLTFNVGALTNSIVTAEAAVTVTRLSVN